MKLLFLTKNEFGFENLAATALERIRLFCNEVKWDIDQDLLLNVVREDLKVDDPKFCIVLAIDREMVIGHLLASIDHWFRKKYLTVQQYKWDDAMPRDQIQSCFEKVIGWGKSRGCTDLQAMAPDGAHERRLKMFYGFERTMIVMRRPL